MGSITGNKIDQKVTVMGKGFVDASGTYPAKIAPSTPLPPEGVGSQITMLKLSGWSGLTNNYVKTERMDWAYK